MQINGTPERTPTYAGDTVNLGADATLDYTFTLGYGLGMRTRPPNGNLVAPENIYSDDGDRNFAKNKLIQNQMRLLGEVNLKGDDWGILCAPTRSTIRRISIRTTTMPPAQ